MQGAVSISVCCQVEPEQDLGILPMHLALSDDASYLAMAGVRHEVSSSNASHDMTSHPVASNKDMLQTVLQKKH